MSIRLKLFLFFALTGIVPLLVLGFYSYISTKKNIQIKTFDEMASINSLSNSILDEWATGSLNLLESLAQRPLLRKVVAELTEADGINSAAARRQELINNHFSPTLAIQNNLDVLSIIDLSGKVVVSTDALFVGQFHNRDLYFTEGQEHSFIGNVMYSVSQNEAVMHVSTPIRNSEGVTIAVLSGLLDWNRASTLLSYVTLTRPRFESYLVNRHHFMLTESKFIEDAPLKVTVTSAGLQACLETGSGQSLYKNYLGNEVLGVYKWLPDHGLCLLTESDLSEQDEALDKLKAQLYCVFLLLAGLSILFALFISSTISRPIRALVAGAAELGRGNLRYQFTETAGELGTIPKALNEMAASLTIVLASRDELNNEVEQRKQVELNLNRAMSDLKKSNQDLEQFAYVASHDLQEPLRTITSYLQLLERRYREHLDSDALEFIDYIVEAASRMKSQINDLLDYSRVGRNDVSFVDVDLNQIVHKVIRQNHIYIQENGATLQVGTLPTVQGIPAQLTQLFQNLINNAIKFHRKGTPPLIRINAERTEDHWNITVADNGIGIEPEYLEKIFIIFQRLHSMVDYPGTGIGLALCKRIVENHDGSIGVTSTPGAGSIFNIKLNAEKI
ncbi:MAG: HAMP domain-containing protein [Desulfuromonadales bacterium]|nr:HAMP domain-containing protein [Desulfuromonadales bacterium]